MDLNSEWAQFIKESPQTMESYSETNSTRINDYETTGVGEEVKLSSNEKVPKCSDLYIYKNYDGILKWNYELIKYSGVFQLFRIVSVKRLLKKTSDFNCIKTVKDIIVKNYNYVNDYIMQHIDNPTGRIKFKDVRKISIGISKKDVISYRIKQKSAFYNCFVVIIRIEIEMDVYKEFHVKVFNTGKLELPGIRSDSELKLVYKKINTLLGLTVSDIPAETVLINSNFTSGYYIKRNNLYLLLKNEYNISAMYDPCSYPGIQCKLYITEDDQVHNHSTTGKYLSFMIFRTVRVLIVGKCNETILYNAYNFIVSILSNNYKTIIDTNVNIPEKSPVVKKKKRRTIVFTNST